MSTIDYKALAERVAQRAIYADNNADPNNKAWAADLRTVVSLLNDMAGQKPFAWAIRDGWSQTRFSVDPDTPILGTRRADYVVDALYLHPAPAAPQDEPQREPVSDSRPCTCHPDDNPPVPCARKYALSECRAASGEPTEAQIKARDALLDFISENGTASEGVQHYLDRYVRAALAAKE